MGVNDYVVFQNGLEIKKDSKISTLQKSVVHIISIKIIEMVPPRKMVSVELVDGSLLEGYICEGK